MSSWASTLKLRPLAIGLAALALLALLWQSDEKRAPGNAEQLRGPGEPDSFVVDGRFRSYNTEGKLQASIQSPRIEQFEARDEAIMEMPKARLIDQSSGQPWRMTANQGRYEMGEELMDLSGDVVILRPNLQKGQDTAAAGEDEAATLASAARLETSQLTLDNKKRIVHTEAPVVIRDPASVTHAVGMRGWVDKGIVQLESQVKGTYEPSAGR